MRMKDAQKRRQEARGFLDKANATSDRAIQRVLRERALRLVQQAGMIEQGSQSPAEVPQDDPARATGQGEGRRRA
jgi:hypothetical protein